MASRIAKYKNKALDSSELRRRREEAGVQIRKAKREEQVSQPRPTRALSHVFLKVSYK